MTDLQALAGDLHERGIALCIDLVLNHTAREHEWASKAEAGDPPYREMYLIYPDRSQPDAYERTLPEVFPDLAPGSFTEVPGLGWVWTTFHEYQWDLNYANPTVFSRDARHDVQPRQPRHRRAPARRGAVPLEADGHRLPEPARGSPAHPGVPRADPAGRARASR